jgi:hypothetical protein
MFDLVDFMKKEMIAALAKEENYYDDGEVNWCFVDADCFMAYAALFAEADRDCEKFYEVFDGVAFDMEKEMVNAFAA